MHVAYCNYLLLVIFMVIGVISGPLLLAIFNIKTVVYILCLAIFVCVVVVVVVIFFVVVVVVVVVSVVEIKT